MREWTTTLISKKIVAKDTFEIHIEKPAGFQWIAGQFIQFLIPRDGVLMKRAYSIASSPDAPDIMFCIKFFQGGAASSFFAEARKGSGLQFEGPSGRFIAPSAPAPLSFIATGTGIGPVLGMIVDQLEAKKNREPIDLLFGVRSEEDLFWDDELQTLTHVYPNFSYRPTISQPRGEWMKLKGRVTEHLSKNISASYFLCGNPEMVRDVRTLLEREGIPKERVHFEVY